MNFNKKYEIILEDTKYELELVIDNVFFEIILREKNSFKKWE